LINGNEDTFGHIDLAVITNGGPCLFEAKALRVNGPRKARNTQGVIMSQLNKYNSFILNISDRESRLIGVYQMPGSDMVQSFEFTRRNVIYREPVRISS